MSGRSGKVETEGADWKMRLQKLQEAIIATCSVPATTETQEKGAIRYLERKAPPRTWHHQQPTTSAMTQTIGDALNGEKPDNSQSRIVKCFN